MTALALDARFTFDSFVVGAANRLASAAARRVAEAPGAAYNPLFIYGGSGLGKTHLLMAIGHVAGRIHPDTPALYDTLEHLMDEVMEAIEQGERDAFRNRTRDVGLLLLDDVQFLAGRHRTQEELLRAWDELSSRGGQIVLSSDRPPTEIDALDDRLLSRFSGGLIVDIGAPDYETRVAIVRRKAEEHGQELGRGVAEALARIVVGNVRELQGSLNRLLAVQDLEGRSVEPAEVARLLGRRETMIAPEAEFEDFMTEVSGAVTAAIGRLPSDQPLADAILRWEGEGYRTRRLEAALERDPSEEEAGALAQAFEADVGRLRAAAAEIERLEPEAPELQRRDVLRDPDRLEDAEALLAVVRERSQPLPPPPAQHTLQTLDLPEDDFAGRAVAAAAERPAARYNPLFLHGANEAERTALIAALGNALMREHGELRVAYLRGEQFSAELIHALERNLVEGWKSRYRRAGALLVDGVDALADTERAQDELFHLFESLQRAGAQLAFTAASPPQELEGLQERLRTRLGSGLVVDLSARPGGDTGSAAPSPSAAASEAGARRATEAPEPQAGAATPLAESAGGTDDLFRSREKLPWEWPYPQDLLLEELE